MIDYLISILMMSFGIVMVLESKGVLKILKVNDKLTTNQLIRINKFEHIMGIILIIISLFFLFMGISILY